MKAKKDDAVLLTRILHYCDKIEKAGEYYSKDEVELEYNEYFQVTSTFFIGQIGENAKNLSEETREKYPEIRWRDIIGMKNIITHAYESYDTEVWWNVITKYVPELRDICKKILNDL